MSQNSTLEKAGIWGIVEKHPIASRMLLIGLGLAGLLLTGKVFANEYKAKNLNLPPNCFTLPDNVSPNFTLILDPPAGTSTYSTFDVRPLGNYPPGLSRQDLPNNLSINVDGNLFWQGKEMTRLDCRSIGYQTNQ